MGDQYVRRYRLYLYSLSPFLNSLKKKTTKKYEKFKINNLDEFKIVVIDVIIKQTILLLSFDNLSIILM